METTLIDSPFSNAANIARALRAAGAELLVTRDPAVIAGARKLVLPGVGSFAAAMQWLVSSGIDRSIQEAVRGGASLLGICVGHQLLFDVSHEMGTTRGLGLIRGEVTKLEGELPVPQIGWNRVAWDTSRADPLFDGLERGTPFYFVHSYAASHSPATVATADYDGTFVAAAREMRVSGVQFHPEKSSEAGLLILRNFVRWN